MPIKSNPESDSATPNQGGRGTPTDPVKALRVPTIEEIGRLAYQLYMERGSVEGYAEQDWLQAELELKEPLRKSLQVPDTEPPTPSNKIVKRATS